MTTAIAESTSRIAGEINAGRVRAHEKHGSNSIEAVPADHFGQWLPILGEEFGEVCKALTYDQADSAEEQMDNLRAELVDVATVAFAWIAAIDRKRAANYAREALS